jgi:NAD(P)-dependent dehydrogenase (short-subunit alcohol dehydrogenase family)
VSGRGLSRADGILPGRRRLRVRLPLVRSDAFDLLLQARIRLAEVSGPRSTAAEQPLEVLGRVHARHAGVARGGLVATGLVTKRPIYGRNVTNPLRGPVTRGLVTKPAVFSRDVPNPRHVAGTPGRNARVDYTAAKAALISLTKSLSEEFAPHGVRVNGVCPGPTRTAWWTDEGGAADIIAAQAGTDRESVMATVAPETMQITSGRLVDPQEIADAVVLLASPRSASTIGAEIVVDGGFGKGI